MSEVLAGKVIGLVGGGNMAEALVRGLLAANVCSASRLHVSEPAAARRAHLQREHGVQVTADNAALGAAADVVVLAVKPQAMDTALASLKGALRADAVLLSIAAGVTSARIEAALGESVRVVRAMPNTAAMALAGATAVARGARATENDVALARALFSAVGRCVEVNESAMDAVTGLGGSGPAYVMLVIEALADGRVHAGLPRDVALLLAAQTVYGAAKLQLDSGEHPAVLKDRVTSPGGTTIAGLARLEAAGVRGAFIDAVCAATRRAGELS